MSKEIPLEEIMKQAKIEIFTEISNKCKCKHDDTCDLNIYLWQKYAELFPDAEISGI